MNLSKLSQINRSEISLQIDLLLNQFTKQGIPGKSDDVEERMARDLFKIWKRTARAAINKNIRLINDFSSRPMDRFLNAMERDTGRLTKEEKAVMLKRLEEVYRVNKKEQSKELGIPFVFGVKDREAVRAVHNDQMHWVDNNFKNNFRERIKFVVERAKENGTSTEDLIKEIKQELSVTEGGTTAPIQESQAVSRFAGRQEEYMQDNVNTAVQRVLAFSSIAAFSEAGVEKYRVRSEGGGTSDISRLMDGRVFDIEDGEELMNEIIEEEDFDRLKENIPFRDPKDVRDEIGVGPDVGLTSAAVAASLAGLMMALPPFKHKGRYFLEPII